MQMASSMFFPPSCHPTQVSIIGAGKVGGTLAQRIAESNVAHVVLLDVVEGLPQGVALDLMQAGSVEGHDRKILGTNDYADTAGSDVVVITAGRPRTPGMNRNDLIETNAPIVARAVTNAIASSPNAVIIIVTNPLDVMTYIAWQVSQIEPFRIMGMAGVLDSARFQAFIATELNVSVADVNATVMGSHGDLMVPLPRYSTVNGIPITELMDTETINRLIARTRNGGAEIVGLLKTGGAYYAPASSVRTMVESILLNRRRLLPTSAYLKGEYGMKDIFLGVPCWLGCRGVEAVLELNLTDNEREALNSCAQSVREGIEKADAVLAATAAV
ncbi:malate dehydrogenase [Limnospira fusiformis CCALA 023]|jgi:malate dehydrogenase|uniref:Malate dehydrogenase n=2 Tax=Oscillatoriophycideae TaxID=1301283 RepID=A0A5M3T2Q6_LIMPL|nr:malate dehydrogenase [Arthrospira platensis NIES-39]GCE92862.1 malate dehydrogenase [Arthrospira platensis NIES-46]